MLRTTNVAAVVDTRTDEEVLRAAIARTDWYAHRTRERYCLVRRSTGEVFSLEYRRACVFEPPLWTVLYVTL